jgi:uncharacterized protein DUF6503
MTINSVNIFSYKKALITSFMFFLMLLIFTNCQYSKNAGELINAAIEAHGGSNYASSEIQFDFRGNHFRVVLEGNKFMYERTYTDTLGESIREVISNKGKRKFINGNEIVLDEKGKSKIDGAVNSVVYFTLLPFPLKDKAVIKRYLGDAEINGSSYSKVEVLFEEVGGGEDFEDRYVYWINNEKNTVDYLAYYFHVNGGGSRFRKMVNPRNAGGILFFDQENYTSKLIDKNIEGYDKIYADGNLEKVSDVILENVSVVKTK